MVHFSDENLMAGTIAILWGKPPYKMFLLTQEFLLRKMSQAPIWAHHHDTICA